MVSVTHEFEMIPAFTVIAGSQRGGVTKREFITDILSAIDTVTSSDHVETMPEFCSLELRDNEAIILPSLEYAQEEAETVDDIPDEFRGDFALFVNDHGNVTCLQWDYGAHEYRSIWDMV